jgi:DNA helicase-2/ATP-dependent DNA helicase PcrA
VLDLSRLNPEQREAVTAGEGPVLVVAGPGSGKTAVIAARVAYLIDAGLAPPEAVLAVTFTNKAGRELRRRLASVLGDEAERIWAGTFHAFALHLLRQWGDHFGFDPAHLTIYSDDDDRLAALDQALADLGLVAKDQPRDLLLEVIGKAKNRLVWPEGVTESDPEMSQVYAAYQEALRRRNAVEFDDFLPLAVRLLEERGDVADLLRQTYRHVLVDEYQDVAFAQHRLLKLLAGEHRNLFVVGDPAQNLYSWRGSDIRYLLDFERDFPEAYTVRLEQNYRSTQSVLDVANRLSAALSYGKRNLWTANPPGVAVVLRGFDDSRTEAGFVTAEVRRLLTTGAVQSIADCAVLYRTNAQAREVELACIAAGIGYSVRGNNDFLARKEVRDLMAYLRLIHNASDVSALGRVINTPPRRLAALEKRIREGEELTMHGLASSGPGLKQERSRAALEQFIEMMSALTALAEEVPPGGVIQAVLERTGYKDWLLAQEDGEKRLANLAAVQSLAHEASVETLADFLDQVGLATDFDTGTDREGIALSTIHAGKGLEWPVVFVTGLEDGLLPHLRSLAEIESNAGAMEEELRLLYVAVTRAIDRLYLTFARRRSQQGRVQEGEPSRFLRHLPPDLVASRAVA